MDYDEFQKFASCIQDYDELIGKVRKSDLRFLSFTCLYFERDETTLSMCCKKGAIWFDIIKDMLVDNSCPV